MSELERRLAAFKGAEACCVFGSGYLANSGIVPTLVGRGDLVLLDDDVESIVSAIAVGRSVFANARRFLTYHLTDNVAELAPFVVWALSGGAIPLALGVLQILLLDIVFSLDSVITAVGMASQVAVMIAAIPELKTAAAFARCSSGSRCASTISAFGCSWV